MAEWDKELNSRKVVSFSLLWSLSFIYRSRTMDFCWIDFFVGLALFSPQFQHSRGYPVSVTWPLLPGTGKRRKKAGVGGMGWGDGRTQWGLSWIHDWPIEFPLLWCCNCANRLHTDLSWLSACVWVSFCQPNVPTRRVKLEITYIIETGQQLPWEKWINKYPK